MAARSVHRAGARVPGRGDDSKPRGARAADPTPPQSARAERVKPEDWAEEPEAPATLDPDGSRRASRPCAWTRPGARSVNAAELIREARKREQARSFLLGALVYRTSRCARQRGARRAGPHALAAAMYQNGFRGRRYSYFVHDRGAWGERNDRLFALCVRAGTLLAPTRTCTSPPRCSRCGATARERRRRVRASAHRHFVSHSSGATR